MQAANSFLQGLMGGATFIDKIYTTKADRDRKAAEDMRAQAVADAKAGMVGLEQERLELQNRIRNDPKRKDFEKRYIQTRKNMADFAKLPRAEQQEMFRYFTTDVINDVMPELINQGNGKGEHKAMIGGEMVDGGIVPIIQVKDDNGKEIRRGPMTMNRSSAPDDKALMVPTSALVDYMVTGKNGQKALDMVQKKMNQYKQQVLRNRGELDTPDERFGLPYMDDYGNLVQNNLTTNEQKMLAKAAKGKGRGRGSGSGGKGGGGIGGIDFSDTWQKLDETDMTTRTVPNPDRSGEPLEVTGKTITYRVPGLGILDMFVDEAGRKYPMDNQTALLLSRSGLNPQYTTGGGGLYAGMSGAEAVHAGATEAPEKAVGLMGGKSVPVPEGYSSSFTPGFSYLEDTSQADTQPAKAPKKPEKDTTGERKPSTPESRRKAFQDLSFSDITSAIKGALSSDERKARTLARRTGRPVRRAGLKAPSPENQQEEVANLANTPEKPKAPLTAVESKALKTIRDYEKKTGESFTRADIERVWKELNLVGKPSASFLSRFTI